MNEGLARAIFGITDASPDNEPELTVLARAEDVTLQTAALWQEVVTLSPFMDDEAGIAIGIFQLDSTHQLLAYAYTDDDDNPRYDLMALPSRDLRAWHGNLAGLRAALPPHTDLNQALPTSVPSPQLLDPQARRAALVALADAVGGLDIALALLDAATRRERLLIYHAPSTVEARMGILNGLTALLPACTRADLTFSLNVAWQPNVITGRLAFGEQQKTTARFQFDWDTATFDDPPVKETRSTYVKQLERGLDGEVDDLLALVDTFNEVANCAAEGDITTRLSKITTRYLFHERVEHNGSVTIEPAELKVALEEASSLPRAWSAQYAELLLQPALEAKDAEAHTLIAAQMDVDPTLDTALNNRMYTMLDDAPDLVYVFMRQRLSDGPSEKWAKRLHDAAERSLDVTFDTGDAELILSWLRLLAREPERFGLEDVLTEGITRALPFTYNDEAFALNLLVLVARFIAPALDMLLNDDAFMLALPNTVRDAFASYDRDALADLQQHGTSLFLVGVGRAANARAGAAFEAGVIERLWGLLNSDKKYNTKSPHIPENIQKTCTETGATWLPSSALETLLGLLLTARDNPLYETLTEHLATERMLAATLPGAFARSNTSINGVLDVVATMSSAGKLDPAGALAVYIAVLEENAWSDETQTAMGAVARSLTQHPDLAIDPMYLQQLLERGAALHDESVTRVAALALLSMAESIEDDADYADQLGYVFSHLAWSTTARTATLHAWRTYVQGQPAARLSRLDAAIDGARVLDDARETLRSVTALRRLIGKRDVAEFAEAINTAYDVMETLSEAFEPDARGADISFDPATVRTTLNHMAETLTPHQRQILSNSLKGLAGLVAQMGDNRTKAGLARSSDSIDRQLIIGEQMPHGAVDAMKWMAGVFSGAQASDEDE
ncbi:MAG: hypothetical protein AAF125_05990 [Chloroflexota bacterium]